MKKNFYPKLALDALFKNKRMYFPYLITGSVMVMMFYILLSMLEAPDLQDINGGSVLISILPYGCGVIAIFSMIFLFYTNSFLMKQRYREFGLYNILGMDKHNISRLMFWEGVYTTGISIGIGLICGMAFSKAADLILLNILNAEISFTMRISVTSLITTTLIYLGIYVLLLLNSIIRVRRSKPLELMQSSRAGEKKLKCNWLFAIVGVTLLGYAYYLAVDIEDPTSAAIIFFVAVIMVIIATYLLFISGSVALCKLLQMNKKYYYKPNHFVSVSSMAYRMKRNGAGLASICILLTMVLVMLSSTTSLYFGEEDSINNRYPNGINITYTVDSLDDCSDEKLDVLRSTIAEYAPDGTNLTGTRIVIAPGQFSNEGITLDTAHVDMVDYSKVGYLYIVSLDDYNNMMKDNKSLKDDECMLYSPRLSIPWKSFTAEYGKTYSVKEFLTDFHEDGVSSAMITPYVYLVVNDIASFIAPLKGRLNSYGTSLTYCNWLCGFDCDAAEEEIAVKTALEKNLVTYTEEDLPQSLLYVESREEQRLSFYEMYGSLFFLGIMLSIVFLLAAVLIIYYKQISEGYEDQSRFEIMQKIGMTKKNIRKSINSQMLTIFFLPLVMAGLHLGFAFPCLSKILKMFAFDNMRLNIIVTLSCFAIFGVFYGIVYKITSGGYYTIVSGNKKLP